MKRKIFVPWSKLCALTLAFALTVPMLAGCNSGTTSSSTSGSTSSTGSTSASTSADTSSAAEMSMECDTFGNGAVGTHGGVSSGSQYAS